MFKSLSDALQILARQLNIQLKTPTSSNSNLLDELDDSCQLSNIRYRQVQLSPDWWKSESDPMLVFFGQDQIPSAVIWKNGWKMTLNEHTIPVTARNSREISPQAFVFYKPLPDAVTYANLLKLGLEGAKKLLCEYFLLIFFGAVLALATPFLYQIVFDRIIPNSDYKTLFTVLGVLIIIAFTLLSFQITTSLILLRIEGSAQNRLTAATWDRLFKLPVSFFRKFGVGDLIQRASMVEEIRQTLTTQALTTIISSLFSVLYLFPMFYFSWQLTLISLIFSLLSFFLTMYFVYKRVSLQRNLLHLKADINQYLIQLVQGISKIRVAGAQERAFDHWYTTFSKSLNIEYEMARIQNILFIISLSLTGCSLILIYFTVFYLSQNQTHPYFTAGTFMAFNAAYVPFSMALSGLSSVFLNFMLIVPYWERSKLILDYPMEEVKESLTAEIQGNVKLQNISFGYTDQPNLLNNLSLNVKKGEFVGIVGVSGSGKSTLFRLLLGFEKPHSGEIFYDDRELPRLNKEFLRQQIGVVLQTSDIITGSIYENILMGRRPSNDDIRRAIHISCLDDFLSQLPMGLDTLLSGGGGSLSGGQKQRLLLARALISNPKILLLDEATSALDNVIQQQIHERLEHLKITRIVIAHNLTTLSNANHIHVLKDGTFVESGSFEELKNKAGIFNTFMNFQNP